jgi:hypothetical protein
VKRLSSVLALTTAGTLGFLLALFTAHGCVSNCAGNCMPSMVYVGSADNYELNGILTDLEVNGPACPPRSGITCLGDGQTTVCTHVGIASSQPGACDVLFVFSDRPSEILRLQFGPPVNSNGSCCKGNTVLGPSVYTIPDKPTGPIYSGSPDAGTYDTDAVVVLTDAGAASKTDAGAADAGAADAGAADAGAADAK